MDELRKYGKDILVNEYEKNVLLECGIDVTKCSNMDEVLILINSFLNELELDDDEYERFEEVAAKISERKYYMGHK